MEQYEYRIRYLDGEWVATCSRPEWQRLSGCGESPLAALDELTKVISHILSWEQYGF